MPAPIQDAWNGFLDWLTKIIVPDWGAPIRFMPLLFSGLVVLVLALLAFRWLSAVRINRTRVPRPLPPGAPPPGVHLPGPSRWPFMLPIGAAILLLGLVVKPDGQVVNWPVLVVGLIVTAAALAGWLRDAMHEWNRVELGTDHGHATIGAGAGGEVPALPAPGSFGGPRANAAIVAARYALPALAGAAAGSTATAAPHGVHVPGPSPWPFYVPVAAMFILFGLVLSPAILAGGVVMLVIAFTGWYRDAGREYRQVEAGHLPEPVTRDPERAFAKPLVGVFGMIAAASVALAIAPALVTFANATPAPVASQAAGGGGAPGGPIQITAQNISFQQTTVTVPAGKPFQIAFENRDSVQHNVAIFDSSKLTKNFFRGTVFAGPKTMTYDVPALPAGTYYFHCDVHPNMSGTIEAK